MTDNISESIKSPSNDGQNDNNDLKNMKKFQQGRWTRQEHEKFLEALELYGKNWKKVEEHLSTRSGAQIRSHAQKFFNRIEKKQNSEKNQDDNHDMSDDIQPENNFSNNLANLLSMTEQMKPLINQDILMSMPPSNFNDPALNISNIFIDTLFKLTSSMYDKQSLLNIINQPPKLYPGLEKMNNELKENIMPSVSSLFDISEHAKTQPKPLSTDLNNSMEKQQPPTLASQTNNNTIGINILGVSNQQKAHQNNNNNNNSSNNNDNNNNSTPIMKKNGFMLVKQGNDSHQKVENLRRKLSLDYDLTKKQRMI